MGILLNLGLDLSFQLLQEKFRVDHQVHRLWHNKFSKINLLPRSPLECAVSHLSLTELVKSSFRLPKWTTSWLYLTLKKKISRIREVHFSFTILN